MNVVVINLARRPDRLRAFTNRWQATNLDLDFEVFDAVDTGTPAGCLASHIKVLSSFPGPLLVLEDDACFGPEFTPFVEPPRDWRIAWLGGQHLTPPMPVDDMWVRPTYLLRTHAYLVHHPAEVAAWLIATDPPRITPYLAQMPIQQYALKYFTVGQRAEVSDIDGKVRERDEFFQWPYGRYAALKEIQSRR